jgi:regulator of protease activity HflC (stomatin/prohibitin superfamily)
MRAHFESAQRFTPILAIVGFACALIGIMLPIVALALRGPVGLGILGLIGASLLIAASGFLATALLCAARHQVVVEKERASAFSASGANRPGPLSWGDPKFLSSQSDEAPKYLAWVSGWPQALLTASFALIAGTSVLLSWPKQPLQGDTQTLLLFSGISFAAAFPLLILERLYTNTAAADLPEADRLARLLRVPLLALVGGGMSIAASAAGFGWWSLWSDWIIGAIILVVAVELLGRAMAAIYLPTPSIEAVRGVADSSCAAWIKFGLPSLHRINAAARREFGIDLSRSWALVFVRRATLPVAAGLAVVGWLLTAVTTLATNERGIYERMGVAMEVLSPGLHIRLPWPFGSVRRLEYGVVHEVTIVPSQQVDERSDIGVETEPPTKAEADPPTSADRLWNTRHPSEVAYLLASAENGKQSFQVVDVDVRLIWRIGLSDTSALNSAYQVEEPEVLVRSAANRLLTRYFAAQTLAGVLRENRELIAGDIKSALQRQLEELSSGIEMLEVVIEAIHPPTGAAYAYHSVQAAEINSRTAIAKEQGNAIRTAKLASQEAATAVDRAQAAASEIVQSARRDGELFRADSVAERRSGHVFLFERWLDRLSHGLSKAQIVIVDHRLTGVDAPIIDLRALAPPAAKSPEHKQSTPR